MAAREFKRVIGGAAKVPARSITDGGWRHHRTFQLDDIAVEVHRFRRPPQQIARLDELGRQRVTLCMVRVDAEPLEIALDAAWDDVYVQAAARDVAQRRGHLRPHAGRDEARTDGDQETDALRDGGEGGGGGPGLGERRGLFEQPVGEARRDQQAVVAVVLGRLDDLAEVVEGGWALGAHGADVLAVAIDGDEPVEAGFRAGL